jgi:hypothetical protein
MMLRNAEIVSSAHFGKNPTDQTLLCFLGLDRFCVSLEIKVRKRHNESVVVFGSILKPFKDALFF